MANAFFAARRPLLPTPVVRRTTILILACLIASAAAAEGALPMSAVAPGVFVHFGAQADAAPANLGAIANIGFIVGKKCVAIVDTGGSIVIGRRLRAAVREVTTLPVCYVINTHVHPDHVFGNAAFKEDRPRFVGHEKLAAALAARGRNYTLALGRDLGPAVHGSELIAPDTVVEGALDLDLGERTLRLRAWPVAHTDNDLTVFDEETGTLWLADLLFVERIPVIDGSLRGWLAVLGQVRALAPKEVVPGHGDGKHWREALAAQERYLTTLLEETRAAIKVGRTITQAVAEVGLSERPRWLLFDAYHRRNVTAAYAELEWED